MSAFIGIYTSLAVGAIVVICVFLERKQARDTDEAQSNIKHSRQDLRLIAYLLFLAVILLGVIADKTVLWRKRRKAH